MSFENKVVLVTGGSSGIGAATAIHFAKEGAQVAIVGRNQTKLDNIAAQISEIGKQPLIINADISNDSETITIVKKTVDFFGKLDVLVNNAGIVRSADMDTEDFLKVYDDVVQTNLRSIVILTNLAVPHLIESKGNVVNVSSIAGTSTVGATNPSGYAAYCVSKAGMNHFSRYAAVELAPKGVRVNTVSPGPVETSIFENAGMTGPNYEWNSLKEKTLMKLITKPEEVANLILYLASDKARSITGSNHVIDGGFLAL